MYHYDPLPSPTHIRLMRSRGPSRTEIPSFTLRATDLDDAPPFDALSYTWGNPFASCVNLPAEYEDVDFDTPSCEVHCNGQPFLVRRNLYDALSRLQYALQPGSGIEKSRAKYIWIDAICINQSDVYERESQVQLMGKLYRRAGSVIIWLGEGDESSHDALGVMTRLAPFIDPPRCCDDEATSRACVSRISSYDIHSPWAIREKLGINPPQISEWLAFLIFFARPYFSRAWILQELVLAREKVVMCGNLTFDFDLIMSTAYFLGKTQWGSRLHPEIFKDTIGADANAKSCIGRTGVLDLEYPPLVNLTDIVTTFMTPEPKRQLAVLLSRHRFRQATDARDKVHSVLGISRPEDVAFSDPKLSVILKPNYRLPVETMYIQTTRLILHQTQTLDFILGKESPLKTQLERLPSWVPDLTAPEIPAKMLDEQKDWCASGEQKWASDGREFYDPILEVVGYKIGTISATSIDPVGTSLVKGWASRGELLEELPVYYRSDASDSRAKTAKRESRLEALCRAAHADTYDNTCPLDMRTVSGPFMDFLIHHMRMDRSSRRSGNISVGQGESLVQIMNERMMDLYLEGPGKGNTLVDRFIRLLWSEPETSVFRSSLFLDRMRDYFGIPSEGGSIASAVRYASESHERWADCMIEMESVADHRLLFTTHSRGGKLLCVGPIQCRPGDEVWVLSGLRSPVILRPSTTAKWSFFGGGNLKRTFLGEAYVHGIMYGEVLKWGISPRRILLG